MSQTSLHSASISPLPQRAGQGSVVEVVVVTVVVVAGDVVVVVVVSPHGVRSTAVHWLMHSAPAADPAATAR